jgi:hypothetical protein
VNELHNHAVPSSIVFQCPFRIRCGLACSCVCIHCYPAGCWQTSTKATRKQRKTAGRLPIVNSGDRCRTIDRVSETRRQEQGSTHPLAENSRMNRAVFAPGGTRHPIGQGIIGGPCYSSVNSFITINNTAINTQDGTRH